MSAFVCGGAGDIEFPDVAPGCCHGSAYRGPEACTCWQPVYNLEQQEPQTSALPLPRSEMCGDCAFRPDSPERKGDESFANSSDMDLKNIVDSGQPFYCHTGMRIPLQWSHPCGAVIDGHPGAYDPPIIEKEGVQIPYKADGSPAFICAGWWARYMVSLKK